MALTSYADLQSQIANWLARDNLTTYIPDFIRLFECAAARKLRVRLMNTTTTLTPSSGVATVPDDFLGARRVTWTGDPIHDLDYVTPDVYSSYLQNGAANPTVYTLEGSDLKVAPEDDSDLTLSYYQKNTAVETSLNWLYENHPDVYLFGSLVEANAFNKGKAFENAALWKNRRDEIFDEIMMQDFNEKSPMAIRVFGITP